MLMPSQSLTSTTTIQTLPSDQQQQQEYVDTLNSQANSTVIKFRREKSMEFDDDTRFIGNINDDINNNHSTFASTDEMIKLESNHSSPASSINEDAHLVIQTSSSPVHLTSPTNSSVMIRAQKILSNRRSVRPSSNHRSTNENEHSTWDEQFEERKPLHTVSAESLCRYLKHYFENTKKFDGTQYEPDTLRSFLLSIERYLKSKKYEYNLMESPLFQSCRQVIMTKREQWRKMGGGNHSNSHHHQSKPSLILSNIKNLTIFDRTKPDGLLLEMYVHITKLCQDKVLAIPQLLWSDIELIDEQYLIRRQQKTENQTIRLCATPSQPSTCPVQAYRLYATHRPPQCNTPQSPFFLLPRTSSTHHIWYKTTAAAKTLEQVLQLAIHHSTLSKQTSSPSLLSNLKTNERSSSSFLNDKSSPISILNGKRTETRISSPNVLPSSKRMHSSPSLVQPLNLVVTSNNTTPEEDSGTASSSPTNSLSNDVTYLSVFNKNASPSTSITNIFHKQSSPPPPTTTTLTTTNPIWDESVTDILLTVAKQRDTRVVKINILRTYLEEKLGVVEFLCLYRGFKSEPKLTFYGTPWEHYQCFLPVLFTLLALDNTTV
ncbi:unnamed protein product [Rotaria magnacalcarata]